MGLRVPDDKTLALIGGDVFINEGFLSTIGGQIEIGSVAGNSNVSLTQVEKGWDVGYEGVENFQDIEFTGAAFVETRGTNTGDIQVQGRNITLTQGSQIAINTEEGQAGNLTVIASESLTLDGNAAEVDIGNFATLIFSDIFTDATGEGSSINIDTPELTITNGGQIVANNFSSGQGVDININASEIIVEGSYEFNEDSISLITSQVNDKGDAGDVTINTKTLTVNEGAQIKTSTFGEGDAGNLTINASESIELSGTIPNSTNPSALFANVSNRVTATGNGGNVTIRTPWLEARDGAQIGTAVRNGGQGGTLRIDAESILLRGFSKLAQFRGVGISGIFVSAERSFIDKSSGTKIPTTDSGGTLNLTSDNLIIEKGAAISADTFSVGDGGNANINVNSLIIREGGEIRAASLLGKPVIDEQRGSGGNLTLIASDSIEVTGKGDINGEQVKSSILTLAESNGKAGNTTITTGKLTVSDGGKKYQC